MDEKPTTYYISYEDRELYAKALQRADGVAECIDPADTYVTEDAATLAAARTLARRREREQGVTVSIYERLGIHLEAHAEDWLSEWIWDEDRLREDVTRGQITRYDE